MRLQFFTAAWTGRESALTILFAVLVVGVILLYLAAPWFTGFRRELKYLNDEIGRNSGREKHYWIRRRRRLWLSIIPFVKYR